jgi:adenylate cyclase
VRISRAHPASAPVSFVPAATALRLPEKPSLAVLPFQNMSVDPEQEYFTDGMVEEITTAIARFPWLSVIARNSAFSYKDKAVDVRQVARELGVRYGICCKVGGGLRKRRGQGPDQAAIPNRPATKVA